MPPRAVKLNGDLAALQPQGGDSALDLEARLAGDAGVAAERICLLHGRAPLASRALLSDLGDVDLQVVILPEGEAKVGWFVRSVIQELCAADGAKASEADERLSAIEITTIEELDSVVEVIARKAFEEPKQGMAVCGLLVCLKARCCDGLLPPPQDEVHGEQAHPMTKALVGFLKRNFWLAQKDPEVPEAERESLSKEELKSRLAALREQAFALMRFVGCLFRKGLLDVKVVGGTVHFLIGIDEIPPGDHQAECVCELVWVIGPSVESLPGGRAMMNHILDRLLELLRCSNAEGRPLLSPAARTVVEELLEERRSNWGRPVAGFA